MRVHPGRTSAGVGFGGALVVLLAVQVALRPRPVAWLVALAVLGAALVPLQRGLARRAAVALGPADIVTLLRLSLTCAVAGQVVQSFTGSPSRPALIGLAAFALVLDAVDGRVARRTDTASPLGARFDMETDALLILVLSGYVAASMGWWVLLVGLARYLLLLAQWSWRSLAGPVRPRRWRKAVAAAQGVVLLVAASRVLPESWALALVIAAMTLLAISFGTEVVESRRTTVADLEAPPKVPANTVVSALALALLWVILTAPSGANLSPWLMARVPVEGLVLAGTVLVLPGWAARKVAIGFGLVAAALFLLKILNIGFAVVLDRPFSPVSDWGYLRSAVGVLADSQGQAQAIGAAVLTCFVALGLLALTPWATLRACQVARVHRGSAARTVAGIGALAIALPAVGMSPWPGRGLLTARSAVIAVREVHDVRAELTDRSVFDRQIAADRLAGAAGDDLLGRLRGKDVLLVFVESYGRTALQGSSFAPGIDAVLDTGTRRLGEAGYHARSAFLTSPTFGAGSWLAHSTLQSGLWVDSQHRYDQLLAAHRLTLTSAFHRAGWRTVFDVPANTVDWPQGHAFYGFDTLYDARNVDYHGPAFGYATMPDQYTLWHFANQELRPGTRPPVMAEIDLVSSHHPWAPLPHLVPWGSVGDGSVFDAMPAHGDTAEHVFTDPDRVRAAYGQS